MTSKAPLSVIIPCFNEEKLLGECLDSVKFAQEVIVVDSFSTDRTGDIAKQSGARFLQHEFWSHGAQNNWAIPQAGFDWVLVVDADERVTPELAEEIQELLRAPAYDGYRIRRRNFFFGREMRHGSPGNDYVLRLFDRRKGRYQEKPVHSAVELQGRVGECRAGLDHYSYATIDDFTRKGRRFIQAGALAAANSGVRSSPAKMLIHAAARFFKSYVLKFGFLDGTEGLIVAVLEADHAFQKYARLWEMQRDKIQQVDGSRG
jgi:glycosyltransferase involved in cell wall biosynthesis